MKQYVIITAGGRGERMNSVLPKQFHSLKQYTYSSEHNEISCESKPVLLYTIEQFLAVNDSIEIILVLPNTYINLWKEYYMQNNLLFSHTIVEGGLSRFHSVRAALKKVENDSIVAVHDGVRPFASLSLIKTMLNYKFQDGVSGIIPAIPSFDSIREVTRDENGEILSSKRVDRDKFMLIQTPQVFDSNALIDAYKRPFSPDFTDDASVLEAAGYKLKLVQGEKLNIKITTQEDMKAAQIILNGLNSFFE